MSVESATYITQLSTANPAAGDPRSQGDDHLRLIKSVLTSSFPNVDGPLDASMIDYSASGSPSVSQTIKERLDNYTPEGTGAVPRTQKGKNNDFISVKDFAATGDGVTDDTAAIQAAIAYAKTSGKTLYAGSEDTFFLGTFTDSGEDVRFLIDFDGFVFDTNNCEFTANASTNAAQDSLVNQVIFRIQDASNVQLGSFKATANTLNRDTGIIGVDAIHIRSIAGSDVNISVGDITGTNLKSTVTCTSGTPATYRYKHLRFGRLTNDGGYYCLNCADNGDDVQAVISTNDIVRSYFVYGVVHHDVIIHSKSHYKFNDILIKRYEFDTKNIRVLYTALSDLVSTATIAIEHENAGDDGVIEDIYIDMNITKSNAANPSVRFASRSVGGPDRSTTTSVTNNIVLRGITNSTTPIEIDTAITGETICKLKADTDLIRGLTDYAKYIVLDGATRLASSDATGSLTLEFNVAEFKFTPTWGKLTVWGSDKPTANYTDYVMREYWVAFTVVSDGSITTITTQTIDTFTAGGLFSSITFPAQSAGSWNFTVVVNGFTDSSRRCRGRLDIFDGQPA